MWQLIVLWHVRCSTNAAHRLWGTSQPFPTRFLTWIPLWRWEARVWSTPKRERHPNCTAVQMETGWSHWAAASAVLATRKATVSAKVGSSSRGYGVHRTAPLSPSPSRILVRSCPSTSASLAAQLHLLSSGVARPFCLHITYAASTSFAFTSLYLLSFPHLGYVPLWLSIPSRPLLPHSKRPQAQRELWLSLRIFCHFRLIILSIVGNLLDSLEVIYLKM